MHATGHVVSQEWISKLTAFTILGQRASLNEMLAFLIWKLVIKLQLVALYFYER
jgi:hypothetical protein